MQKSPAQQVGPFFGLLYVAIGIIGFFVTGFDNFLSNTPDKLIGFSINPLHNLVHLLIGGFLIIMCRQTATMAEGAVMGVGLFYIVAFVIGVAGTHDLTILSMSGRGDLENFNHIVNGVLLLALGLISSAHTEASLKHRGFA